MTLYQVSYSFAVIETPLSDQLLKITKDDLLPPPDPVRDAQRQLLYVLLLAVLAAAVMAVVVRPFAQDEALAAGEDVGSDVAAGAPAVGQTVINGAATGLSPVFSPEVQHWAPQILAWSAEHGVDPDITATIMQIESCGDPQAVSSAGARGLFQVMPFHFEAHEDMHDPATNAYRGLSFFTYVFGLTDGDVGRALAGYNGGPGAALSGWDHWVSETQRYYTWGTGIYGDAKAGLRDSPTLQSWQAAGGASLCRQAAQRLGL